MFDVMLFAALALLAFAVLWDPFWRLLGVKALFPWELQRMLRADPEGVRLVDVRQGWEYRWFHIPGAAHMPEVLDNPGALPEVAGKTTVFICMTGHRSPVAAWRSMRSCGHHANLVWGMAGWRLWGGKTVSGSGAGYS